MQNCQVDSINVLLLQIPGALYLFLIKKNFSYFFFF